MSPPTQSKALPLHKSFAASAIAACTAEVTLMGQLADVCAIDCYQLLTTKRFIICRP